LRRIDKKILEFEIESRNMRIILAMNEMNPHGNLSSKHKSLSNLLIIYNLHYGYV